METEYSYGGYTGDAPANLSYTVQEAVDFGSYRQGVEEEYGRSNIGLQLTDAGCPQRDNTGESMSNCSMSCMDPQFIFNDTATL